MRDVFISYNHKDKPIKDELVKIFDKAGITYFEDVNDLPLGEDIETHLRKNLRETKFTVMLVSKSSLFSTWVGMEAISRLQQDLFNQSTSFLPILLDKSILKTDFPIEIAKVIHTRKSELEKLRDELKSLGQNTEIYDIEINRIASTDSLAILKKIRNSRMVDFTEETRKTQEIEKLLDTLKPERKKTTEEVKKQKQIEEKRIKDIEEQRKIEENKALEAKKQKGIEEKRIRDNEEKRKIEENKALEAKKQKEIDEKQLKIDEKQKEISKESIKIVEEPKIIENIHQDYIEKINDVEFKMIYVEGGTFIMGSNNGRYSEKPAHQVTLDGFYVAENQVTQKLYEKVMGNNPSYFQNCPQCPVEQVSWEDAQAFIRKLNQLTGQTYRLPTEAEWEYAARGGNKSKGYQYAGSNNIDEVAWYDDNSGSKPHPVKTKKKPNELGIYDMSGNVWEWCSDWYGHYSANAQTNPTGPINGSLRRLRGGCWYNFDYFCRVLNRNHLNPRNRSSVIGFRLLRTP
jgi:formylglycine-generating enzyme required for sulfatase activity